MNASILHIPDKEAVIDFGGLTQLDLKQPKKYLKRVRGNGVVLSLILATFFIVRPLVIRYFKRYYKSGEIQIPLSKHSKMQQIYLNWKTQLDKIQEEKGEDHIRELENEMKVFSAQKKGVLEGIDLKGLSFLKRLLLKQIILSAMPYFKFSVDVYLHFKALNDVPNGKYFKTVPTEELLAKRPESHEYLV